MLHYGFVDGTALSSCTDVRVLVTCSPDVALLPLLLLGDSVRFPVNRGRAETGAVREQSVACLLRPPPPAVRT
jgi:hypothetical protein